MARTTYDQTADYYPPEYRTPDLLGRGGCPGNDETLVPDLPFDFLQPQMRKQVSQVGYGGPFVIRSNPIGAIVDAIRGFCFPAAMEQVSSDGGVYADSGGGYSGLDTAGLDGYPYVGSFGGGLTAPASPSIQCMQGELYNPNTNMCVPTPGATTGANPPNMPAPSDNCGSQKRAELDMMFSQARNNRDVRSMCQTFFAVDTCANAPNSPADKAAWAALRARMKAEVLIWTKGLSCDKYLAMPPATTQMTPQMMPMTTGMATPPSGGSPGTDNSGMMGSNNPFAYINLADSMKGGQPGQPGMMTVTNPPNDNKPTAPNVVNQAAAYVNRFFPPMPNVPNPMSMTEGNVRMLPSAEPMGGSFDPASSIPTRQRSLGQTRTIRNRYNLGVPVRRRF